MIRFGVLGAGRIARTFSEAMHGTEGVLYAVASRDGLKAAAFKEDFQFEVAYGSYEAMLKDPLVDCVYIATPHAFHYEQMLASIEHGKAILCEKAFTLNRHQAEIVFARAKAKGVFVMEAMWSRFLPVLREAITHVEAGTLGDLTHFEANFSFKADHKLSDQSRLFNLALGGGALLDIGIYPINFAHVFLGLPKHVDATVTRHHTGADLSEVITFQYDKATARLTAGFDSEAPIEATLYGTKGKLHMPLFWALEKAILYDSDDTVVDIIEQPHRINGFEYQIEDVIACLQAGKLESLVMPHQTTLDMLGLMDGLRAAWDLKYPGESFFE